MPNEGELVIHSVKGKTIQPGVPFGPDTAADILRVDYAQGERAWTAYISSNPHMPGALFEAELEIDPEPLVRIRSGWIFIVGWLPAGRTQRVKAGAVGTALIVQNEGAAGDETDRVFFLGKNWYTDTVQVFLTGDLAATLTETGQWAEVDSAGQLTTGSLAAGSERAQLVDAIHAKLQEAGYQP